MKLISIKRRKTKNNLIIDQKIGEINVLYESGLSLSKIGKQLGIGRKALTRLFKNNNIETRKGYFYARKYNLNEHYFDNIDTEEKAYILGFIYADGNNLYSTNRINFHLSLKDEEILKKFSNIFYNEHILKYNSKKNDKGEIFHYVSLSLYSKYMSQFLISLGVMERKSDKIIFPIWLNKSLYKHFIRGLIDGDGWIYLPKSNRDSPNVGLICTRQINDILKQYFENELGIKSYLCKAYKQNFNVMCEIRVKNYHQDKIFLDWLYGGATIYLQRKYALYQDFLKRHAKLREQNK